MAKFKNEEKIFFAGLTPERLAREFHEAFESVQIQLGVTDENEPFEYADVSKERKEIMERVCAEILFNFQKEFKVAPENLEKTGEEIESIQT